MLIMLQSTCELTDVLSIKLMNAEIQRKNTLFSTFICSASSSPVTVDTGKDCQCNMYRHDDREIWEKKKGHLYSVVIGRLVSIVTHAYKHMCNVQVQ